MLFWLAVFKMHEKKLLIFKTAKMAFLAVNNFFGRFQKYQKKTCVCSFFLKLNQSRNTKKNLFWEGFLQKPKTHFFGGKNKIVFSNLYVCICSLL